MIVKINEHSHADLAAEGIIALDEDSPRQDNVMSALLEAYRDQGYQQGYTRGSADLLAGLLEAVESFVREIPQPADNPRQLLYEFEKYLERFLRESRPNSRQETEFVSDGLGI